MANPEHLAILKKGVEVWNKWRQQNPDIKPDLSGADLLRAKLKGANLCEVNLEGADLRRSELEAAKLLIANLNEANLWGANLNSANLWGAKLERADLRAAILTKATLSYARLDRAKLEAACLWEAHLEGANLSGANMKKITLSGCVIDKDTVFQEVQDLEIGVNGIYYSGTNSAALMQMTPPGNSMQGSNSDAIVESLKHARKLHNISLIFAGIALLIAVLKPASIKIPFFSDFSSEPTHYAVLAIFCSIGILTLTESFIRAALEGAQYINDRDSAMKVGHFPWTISKYDKGKWGKWQSLIMRLILCFHPLVYPTLYFSVLPNPLSALFPAGAGWLFYLGNGFVVLAFLGLLALCGRIFWLSQQFQKPILFDPETERKRKSDAAILNDKITELIEILKPKETITKNSVVEVSPKNSSS